MKRKTIICEAAECSTRGRRPMCDKHMAQLSPVTRDRLMSAFQRSEAGRADGLRIYTNMVTLARNEITAKAGLESPNAASTVQAAI